jgi:hypothetical protein
MAEKKTYTLTNLTIGSKIYVVHKDYANKKKSGGKVLGARVVSFVNTSGKIQLEFKLVNHPTILDESFYTVFTDVKKAITAIKSK